jgi:hypothetical protein
MQTHTATHIFNHRKKLEKRGQKKVKCHAPRTLSLLVDDGVNSNSCLASLPVSNDELTLAAADRDERIHSLQACLHRLVH